MSNDHSSSMNDSGSYRTQETEIDQWAIAWVEACTPAFMAANTDAPDFESFAKAGGFDVWTQEGRDAIVPSELDAYVNEHTRFPTWAEMKALAFADWTRRKEAEEAGVSPRQPHPLPHPPLPDDMLSELKRRKTDRPVDD